MFDYYYCNSAIIIYLCTIYLFYAKKHITDTQSRFFEIMLWTGITSCFFDIISEEAIMLIGDIPNSQIYLTLYIYYIFQNSIPILSTLYILAIIDKLKQMKFKEKVYLYTPTLISGMLIMTNNWTNLVFYVDDNLNYRHGIGLGYLFVQAGYYFIYNIFLIIYYKKYITKQTRHLLIFMSVAVIVTTSFDVIFDLIMIYNLSISICMLLLFIAIQNSEEALIDSSGLYTHFALIRRSQLSMINKNPFTILLIKLEDKAIINYTFGLNYWFSLLKEVSIFLNSFSKQQTVYNLEDGLYAIMFHNNLHSTDKFRVIQDITTQFKATKWNVLNTELALTVQMLELSYPMDMKDTNDVFNYIEYYSKNMIDSRDDLLTAASLNVNQKEYHSIQRKLLWDILDRFQYELCFMPIYSVSKQRIIAREPLLKLPTNPPTYVSPGELDHVTEDYQRLKQIYQKIFEDICIYMKEHPSADDDFEYMNINITAAQMMQEDLMWYYSSLVNKYGISPKRIGVEMSEAIVSYTQPSILRNIMALKQKGISFILDQYGTGYNSLEYFKHVPFEFVKLNKSLVKACLDNEKGPTILRSILVMMNQLKVTVIADGVDTKELAEVLIANGINDLEGPYYL